MEVKVLGGFFGWSRPEKFTLQVGRYEFFQSVDGSLSYLSENIQHPVVWEHSVRVQRDSNRVKSVSDQPTDQCRCQPVMFLHLNIHENDPFKGQHWSFMSHRSQFEEMMIVNVCSGIASLSGEVSLAQGNVHFPNEPSNSQSFPKHSQINLQTTFLFLFQLTYLGSNEFMFYYMQYLNFPLSHVSGTEKAIHGTAD